MSESVAEVLARLLALGRELARRGAPEPDQPDDGDDGDTSATQDTTND